MTILGARDLLGKPAVRTAIRQAWEESGPGITGGHEEGGFILQGSADALSVARWPRGAHNSICVPPHPSCRVGSCDIAATFHTHPNAGHPFLQEPSETDRRAVRDDPDLKGNRYQGELVISQETIFLVSPGGQVGVVGATNELLGKT